MYESQIANAANTACNLSACVRDVLEQAQFTIENDTIEFHNDSDGLLADAVLELLSDSNEKALAVLKATINRESKLLENFGAVYEETVKKNGSKSLKCTQKGFGLSFKKQDNSFIWTVRAPKTEQDKPEENILVETAKMIADSELSSEQFAKLARILANAAATL